MNCKPGDRAVIVRNTHSIGCVEREMGLYVTVEQPVTALGVMTLTVIRGWSIRWHSHCRHCGQAFFVPDADLQPIRGDRASDTPPPAETPLPKPMVEPVL